ncbi:MAG: glycoside hydrolase family 2 [Ruminococcaceae bacterium]|nr:glycoside hydrolase family 2 [Oscillospiraceae bacterium]
MKSDFEKNVSLNGQWDLFFEENKNLKCDAFTTFKALKKSHLKNVPATVPGNFEIDLEKAGIIDDIFFGNNPLDAQKRENYHLWYVKKFTSDSKNYNLVFDGIDTFADIYLNGKLVGTTDNMLISHSFDAEPFLKKGENELVVHIKPTFLLSRGREFGAGVIKHQEHNAESLVVRKAAHMYGWDIMPRILSGGIWLPVNLIEKREEFFTECYLSCVKIENGVAALRLHYGVKIAGDLAHEYRIKISGNCKDSSFEQVYTLWYTSGTRNFFVQNPYLWWTKDLGEQNLYAVKVELILGDKVMDCVTFDFGFRVFGLLRSSLADENSEFCFTINGQRLFVRGTNWVPLDALHSRDAERLPKALELLGESGCNMVRCWGGNVYENEAFFDYCDQKGIAVWQDFAMGCATYPLTRQVMEDLEKEAVCIVKKYRQHTSLALWAGDNECDECCALWTSHSLDPNRNLLTRQVIPYVLNLHDPERIYLPSSPYIDSAAFESGMFKNTPEKHLWGPRDYFKSDFYTKSTAKFASETGYHGCPSPASIEKFIDSDHLWPYKSNQQWLTHATCMEKGDNVTYAYRIPLMASQIGVLFKEEPLCLADFSKMSQASQAEAMKFFVERFRMGKTDWRRTGIIWWNLLDGWPQFSDAVTDYYFTKKLAFYVTKRSQNPVCLMMSEPDENGKLTLVGANETMKNVTLSYKVTELTENRVVLCGEKELCANSAEEISLTDYLCDELRFYLIEWNIGSEAHKNYYLSGKGPFSFKEYYALMKLSGMWEADALED